jgi:conjugal transfer/type IV secretion protein DotA/TraY
MAVMPFSPCDASAGACADVTVKLMTSVFGPVIQALVSGDDPGKVALADSLIGTLMGFFNSGILVVGSLLVSYIAVIGAVNTANDGEALGKMWSSVWTPVRIVAYGGALLPTASGYSFIQILVLMIALWSVGFANGAYKLGMAMGILKPDGIVASSTDPGTYLGLRGFASNYLAASYCAKAANSIYADTTNATPVNPSVMADSAHADRTTVNGTKTDYTFYIKDRNAASNLGGGEPICGSVTLSSYAASGTYTDDSGVQQALDEMRSGLMGEKLKAAVALMKDIDDWVAGMPADISQAGWSDVDSKKFNEIVKKHEDAVVASIINMSAPSAAGGGPASVNNGVKAFLDSMTKEGWAMAGGWYQRVGMLRSKLSTITSEPVGEVEAPSLSGLPNDSRASLLKASVSTVTEAIAKGALKSGSGYTAANTRPEDIAAGLPKDATSDINVGSLNASTGAWLTTSVNNMMNGATNIVIGSSSDVDAISRMKTTGDILAAYQVMLWTAEVSLKTAMTATRVVVGTAGGVEVLGNKVDMSNVTNAIWEWIVEVPAPILAKMASYVGILAFYFGVALPSLPYAIFMITVVGWLVGVLQSVVAVTMWAIMHMRPSQTFIGSEAQGYLLLMALFARPILAVLGLFGAHLIADPAVDYIAKAFFAMRGDVVASTGLLGALAQFMTFFWWFTAFGGVLLPVLYMVYGLPQVFPDRVLAWLNAGVGDLGTTGATTEMQRRMDSQGARAALGGAGGSAGAAGALGGPGGRPGGGGGSGGGGKGVVRGGGGGSLPLSANQQGVAPPTSATGSPAASSAARPGGGARRSYATRISDGAGVALGRVATDSAMAVSDAAAGGRRGFARRAAGGVRDAVMTAGSEGVAAYQGGADGRINNFKAGMAVRRSMQGDLPTAAAAGAGMVMSASAAPAMAAAAGSGQGSFSSASLQAPQPSPRSVEPVAGSVESMSFGSGSGSGDTVLAQSAAPIPSETSE